MDSAERVLHRYLAASEPSWIVQQVDGPASNKVHDLVLPNRTVGVAIANSKTLQNEWRAIVRALDLDQKRSRTDVGYNKADWDTAVTKITNFLMESPQACGELMALGTSVGYPKGTAALDLLGPDFYELLLKGVLKGPQGFAIRKLLGAYASDLSKDALKKVVKTLWTGLLVTVAAHQAPEVAAELEKLLR